MYEEYKNIDLEKQHIYFLRTLGRELGIKSPTSMVKKQLIEEIKKVFNGNYEYKPLSKRGRPAYLKKEVEEMKKIKIENAVLNKNIDIINFLDKLFEEYKVSLRNDTEKFIMEIEKKLDKMKGDLSKNCPTQM